jgi:hypothetical protein
LALTNFSSSVVSETFMDVLLFSYFSVDNRDCQCLLSSIADPAEPLRRGLKQSPEKCGLMRIAITRLAHDELN